MASQGAHPACLFLTLTLFVTMSASALLVTSIWTTHWETIKFDRKLVEEITAARNNTHRLTWLMSEKVAKIEILQSTGRLHDNHILESPFKERPWSLLNSPQLQRTRRQASRIIYLVPTHGGIWTICIDLIESEQEELFLMGYPFKGCFNFLADEGHGITLRNEWIQRMQNLSISCSLVCCILLGASALLGIFGTIKRQISAVYVTGVMYILATIFGTLCLVIVHFKRNTKRDYKLVDSQITREYAQARIFEMGWSMQLGWVGVVACLAAAVLWLVLSKIMRYNPVSLS